MQPRPENRAVYQFLDWKEKYRYNFLVDKETIRKCIRDGQERLSAVRGISRESRIDHEFLAKSGKTAAILGPRRAGKTFRLFQVREELAIPADHVTFIDFSDLSLRDFAVSDFGLLASAASELNPPADELFLFDEIQEVEGFEAGIRHLQNKGRRVYLTGSNSNLFSESLASSLRGKILAYEQYPLSFSEFLSFRKKSFRADPSSSELSERRRLLDEYLLWGGFPEVVLADLQETKRALLDSYLDVMIFRDIVERHGLSSASTVERVFLKILASFAKEYSVNRWYNDFKSRGLRVGKDSLYDVLRYFEEAYVVKTVANLASPGGARKVYLVDNGFYRGFLDRSRDFGKLWENCLFVALSRRGVAPSFWRTEKGEIDFVLPNAYVQATIELTDENRERELGPFELVRTRLGGREEVVLSPDEPPPWL